MLVNGISIDGCLMIDMGMVDQRAWFWAIWPLAPHHVGLDCARHRYQGPGARTGQWEVKKELITFHSFHHLRSSTTLCSIFWKDAIKLQCDNKWQWNKSKLCWKCWLEYGKMLTGIWKNESDLTKTNLTEMGSNLFCQKFSTHWNSPLDLWIYSTERLIVVWTAGESQRMRREWEWQPRLDLSWSY